MCDLAGERTSPRAHRLLPTCILPTLVDAACSLSFISKVQWIRSLISCAHVICVLPLPFNDLTVCLRFI